MGNGYRLKTLVGGQVYTDGQGGYNLASGVRFPYDVAQFSRPLRWVRAKDVNYAPPGSRR